MHGSDALHGVCHHLTEDGATRRSELASQDDQCGIDHRAYGRHAKGEPVCELAQEAFRRFSAGECRAEGGRGVVGDDAMLTG
jgi:hypothetical protein